MLPHASGTSRAARGKISPAWRRTGTTLVRGKKTSPVDKVAEFTELGNPAGFLA